MMEFLGFFKSKKDETLKTDNLRRTTHEEVAVVKGTLDKKFDHLSKLVDEALLDMQKPREKTTLHSKREQ